MAELPKTERAQGRSDSNKGHWQAAASRAERLRLSELLHKTNPRAFDRGVSHGWRGALREVAANPATWPGFLVNLGVSGSFFAFAGLMAPCVALLFFAIWGFAGVRGFGLGLGVHLGPLLLLIALRGPLGSRGVRLFLGVSLVLMIALFAIMMGVGGLVTRANVGLFQRAYALTLFPWISVGAWHVLRLRRRR